MDEIIHIRDIVLPISCGEQVPIRMNMNRNAGQIIKDLLVFLIEILPVLIILIPVVWLLIWLVKKVFRLDGSRARARREARAAKKAAKKAAGDAPHPEAPASPPAEAGSAPETTAAAEKKEDNP
jgi:hypothetical protein